jgi:four helix bundle protein
VDRLSNNIIHAKSSTLFSEYIAQDSEILSRHYLGREIAKQLIRSLGSICANLEEGYGRSFGKEYVYYLRVARGSARESKGWYQRSNKFLAKEIIQGRVKELDEVISMLVGAINALS